MGAEETDAAKDKDKESVIKKVSTEVVVTLSI